MPSKKLSRQASQVKMLPFNFKEAKSNEKVALSPQVKEYMFEEPDTGVAFEGEARPITRGWIEEQQLSGPSH